MSPTRYTLRSKHFKTSGSSVKWTHPAPDWIPFARRSKTRDFRGKADTWNCNGLNTVKPMSVAGALPAAEVADGE